MTADWGVGSEEIWIGIINAHESPVLYVSRIGGTLEIGVVETGEDGDGWMDGLVSRR